MSNPRSDDATPTSLGPLGSDDKQYPWVASYPAHLDWAMTFEARPVGTLLDTAARDYPNHTCTNFLGRKLTYKEIEAQVRHTAAGLQKLGIKKGTKVGLLLPNCPTFIVYYFARHEARRDRC